MTIFDDTISRFNAIRDIFGQPFEMKETPYHYQPATYTISVSTKSPKRIHYYPSRNGGRWK